MFYFYGVSFQRENKLTVANSYKKTCINSSFMYFFDFSTYLHLNIFSSFDCFSLSFNVLKLFHMLSWRINHWISYFFLLDYKENLSTAYKYLRSYVWEKHLSNTVNYTYTAFPPWFLIPIIDFTYHKSAKNFTWWKSIY